MYSMCRVSLREEVGEGGDIRPSLKPAKHIGVHVYCSFTKTEH